MAKDKKPKNIEEAGPEVPPKEEQKRPGTSATENLLMTNRQAANKQFRAAQRAEEAYKAKKRSAGARKHSNDAKVHFQQSAHHLKEFFKSIGNLIMAGPWMYRAWQEKRREIADEKTKTRNAEKRKKLEEQLNKHAEEDKEIEV